MFFGVLEAGDLIYMKIQFQHHQNCQKWRSNGWDSGVLGVKSETRVQQNQVNPADPIKEEDGSNDMSYMLYDMLFSRHYLNPMTGRWNTLSFGPNDMSFGS